jgi:DNA-binding XRE family transcriptional regulator
MGIGFIATTGPFTRRLSSQLFISRFSNPLTFEIQSSYAGVTNKAGVAGKVKSVFAMPRKKYPANVVGTQIRKARRKLGLTQEALATRCQLAGLDISRSTMGQIEARLRYVTDGELIVLASLLGVTVDELYPEDILKRHRGKKVKPKKTR